MDYLVKFVDKIEEHLACAEKQCQQRGSKLTPKRRQVLTLLLEAEKAVSAYDLIIQYHNRFQMKMPPMSAYRILNYLEEMHLAHKIHVANKYVACSQIGCSGTHQFSQLLFCDQCQRVSEIPLNSAMNNEITTNVQQTGYQLRPQQIELTCVCNSCMESEALLEEPLQSLNQG